ncbi:MAG: hypothetical protein ACERKD_24825 [Prolixibacteraceae bacterium]
MITIDQLEVLLRSIPQYFLFGGLGLYIYAWIEKKPQRGIWGEVLFVLIGLCALIILISGMIPSPNAEGLVQDHVERVIKMLSFLTLIGLLSSISIIIRLLRKKHWVPLVLAIFALALYLFFNTTGLAKVKFELNNPPIETHVQQ